MTPDTARRQVVTSDPQDNCDDPRFDKDGNKIPRSIINRFTCDFNGQSVIDVALEPAISTNPYFKFDAVVPETGEFKFTWYDDDGSVYETAKKIAVG